MAAEVTSTSPIKHIKPWDGDRGSFDSAAQDLSDTLVMMGCAQVDALNLMGLPAPAVGVAATRQNALSWVAIMAFLGPLKKNVVANCDAAAAAAGNVKVVCAVDEIPADGFQRCANRLWAAATLYSMGAIPDVSGPEFQTEVESVRYPPTGTYAARTTAVIDQLDLLLALAERLADADYPFSQALACSKFRSIMPARYQQDFTTYESIRSISVLRARAMRDARRCDTSVDPAAAVLAAVAAAAPASDASDRVADAVASMAAKLASANLDPVVLAGILTDVARNAKSGGGARRDRGERGERGPRPQRPKEMNKSTNPGDGRVFCDHHGWCAHRTPDCKHLNGAPAPTGAGRKPPAAPAEQTLYRSNGDGTFSKLSQGDVDALNLFAGTGSTGRQYHVDGTTGQLAPRTRPLTESDVDAIVAATGVSIGSMYIIDTGAEVSMAQDAHSGNPDATLATTALVIDGSNPGSGSSITHTVDVVHDCGTFQFKHGAVGPSKYNIVSTNDLGKAGVSVLLNATDADNQSMLLFCADDPTGSSTVAAVRVGGLWAMPRSDLPGAAARSRCAARAAGTPAPVAAVAAARATGGMLYRPDANGNVSIPFADTAAATAGVVAPTGVMLYRPDANGSSIPFADAAAATAGVVAPAGVMQCDLPRGAIVAVNVAAMLPRGIVVLSGTTGTTGITSPTFGTGEVRSVAEKAVVPVTTGGDSDYAEFRKMFGRGSHRATLERARELGVTLTGATPEARAQLDLVQRTANARQSASRAVNVDGGDRNLSRNDLSSEPLILSGDTIGNRLATSAAGNESAQVWVRIGDPTGSYYVTVDQDHTAATTRAAFQRYCRYRQFTVLSQAISQPVRFASDGGSEFQGEFRAMLTEAGIPHDVAIAYKSASGKQALAESAAGVAQQAMRRDVLSATANFASIGHDSNRYWDHAIVYAGIRATQAGRRENGDITKDTLNNLVPAPFGALVTVELPSNHPDNAGVIKQSKVRGPTGVFLGTDGSKRKILLPSGRIYATTGITWTPATAAPAPTVTPAAAVPEPTDDDDDRANIIDCSHGPDLPLVNGVASVGDSVSVYWPAEGATYHGTITEIDPSNDWHEHGSFTVHYPEDDDIRAHALEDAELLQVTVLAAVRNRDPHASIAQHITDAGNIEPDLLNGVVAYVPPPFPLIRQDDAPLAARGLQNALADELAPHHLQATLNECHGHSNLAARAPLFELVESTRALCPDAMHEVWVFRLKFVDGVAVKIKARCAADGSAGIRGVTFHESYVGTAPLSDIRRLEVRALLCKWFTWEWDMAQAYCQHAKRPRPDGKQSLVAPAKGNQIIGTNGFPMLKALQMELYGEGGAGDTHVVETTDSLLGRNQPPAVPMCPLTILRCPYQPTTFKVDFNGSIYNGEHLTIYLHNDNIRVWSSCPAAVAELHQWLQERWEITGSATPLQNLPPTELLGITTTYGVTLHGTRWFSLNMKGFIAAALREFHALPGQCKPTDVPMITGFCLTTADYPTTLAERREVRDKAGKWFHVSLPTDKACRDFYAKVVSTVGWIVKCIAPIIALAFSVLGRAMTFPCTAAFKACRQLLRYLSTRADIELYYQADRNYDWKVGDWPEYQMTTDAGMFGDSDGRSQGGHEGHFTNMAIDQASSSRIKGVVTSTFHAEATEATSAAKQAAYVFNVDGWLGATKGGPIPIGVDNLATVLSAARPKFSPKSKHFNISARYLAELVEDGIVYTYHVPGTVTDTHPGIASDALTKPLSAGLIAHYYPILQGRRPTA